MTDLKRTPFYDLQAAQGARFVPFAGWEMPVQFSGVIAEHKAVREAAGLFDVSHMGEVTVRGPGAFDGLQYVITNDLSKLEDGGALYTAMCLEDGGIVDDLIVYRLAQDDYFICINAGRRDEDVAHFHQHLASFDCVVEDCSDSWAQLALQGPTALEVFGAVSDLDAAGMQPFTFVDARVGGVDGVRVARTGYTGEDGVELYLRVESAAAVFEALVAAGEARGLQLCGLGARDTLRLEMKYALYGNDIDTEHNPYEGGLGWVVKLKKGDFLGRDALAAVKEAGPKRKLVGFKMEGRGIPRQGYAICVEGADIGVVTSGTHSPSLGEAIGVGYVDASLTAVGSQFNIRVRGKEIPAVVVKTPFYKRES
jgi:aminomethyltransferase